MCLLTYIPPGVTPVRKHLENGARLNPHGHGWAVAYGGNLFMMRGLDPVAVIAGFLAARAKFPYSHGVFHSRYASVTEPTLEACHPLLVGGNAGRVVAHNGFLFTVPDGRSDTQAFAADILPSWDLFDDSQRAELERQMGDSRAVILSADHDPVILNAHLGVFMPNRIWHSNPMFTGVALTEPGKCALCDTESSTRICADCQAAGEPRRVSLYLKREKHLLPFVL